jgi:hypothetical protein
MKDVNYSRYMENNKLLHAMENGGIEREIEVNGRKQKVLLTKDKENPPVGPKYLVNSPFKFGGKKKTGSNSGGVGRAGRRHKRHGKGSANISKTAKH